MVTKTVTLKMVRGDSQKIGVKVRNLHEAPTAIVFSLKKSVSHNDYIFQKTLDNGIAEEGEGRYIIKINPADTEQLAPASYQFDLEMTFGEDVITLVIGTLEIIADVTRHL